MPKLIKLTLFFSTILALILGLIFLINYEKKQNKISSYYSEEDTPVPIPNTEVKLFSADGTWWATAWESRT